MKIPLFIISDIVQKEDSIFIATVKSLSLEYPGISVDYLTIEHDFPNKRTMVFLPEDAEQNRTIAERMILADAKPKEIEIQMERLDKILSGMVASGSYNLTITVPIVTPSGNAQNFKNYTVTISIK